MIKRWSRVGESMEVVEEKQGLEEVLVQERAAAAAAKEEEKEEVVVVGDRREDWEQQQDAQEEEEGRRMCVRSRPVMRRRGALPSLIFLFTALAFSRGMAAAFVVGPSPLPAPIPFQKPAPPPHVRSHRAMPQTVGAMAGVDDGGLSEEMRLLKEKIRLNKNRAQELERMLGQNTRTSPSPSPSPSSP
jgi:hypothetical protein